ncbi:hypothetical protein RND81_06G075600 [Saponaria officinalis]|uniref:C2H2-type domain-containing protein n=1 Tax=Saponaria officinalis TaxID=3572 RepID=A0AAW1K8M1_SAPOF
MDANLNQTGKSKPSNKQTSSIMDENYVRSYVCDFCKKGFSNAQALGGHMNIHRRDRAKLRQSSMDNNNEGTQSENSTKTGFSNRNLSVILDDQCSTQSQQSTSTNQNQIVTSSIIDNKGDDISVRHELPLFVDGQLTSMEGPSGTSRLRSDELNLDLELRLGSKPQNKHPT